jgi:hypothetical protein
MTTACFSSELGFGQSNSSTASSGALSATWVPGAPLFEKCQKMLGYYLASSSRAQRTQEWGEAISELIEDQDSENTYSTAALSEIIELTEHFPLNIPLPSLVVEPSGAIACEWYVSPSHVFVLSVIGNQTLEFAALMGEGNEINGRRHYAGALPEIITSTLRQFLREAK